jgi:hypothetical protein
VKNRYVLTFSQAMNAVEYTLVIQKLFSVMAGLSFIAVCAQLVFLDPSKSNLYVWGILLSALIFITSFLALFSFWWFFSIKKDILRISQVNNLIYNSLISACIPILLIVMNQTKQLNFWSGILVLVAYVIYFLWANSEAGD